MKIIYLLLLFTLSINIVSAQCCGNGICEPGEDSINCPYDCPPSGSAANCPNTVGSFNTSPTWPVNYATAQANGWCYTFNPPYPPTICFEYVVPPSTVPVQVSFIHSACNTSSINQGNSPGGCNSASISNSAITSVATYDDNCNLISNTIQTGGCYNPGDIITVCLNLNQSSPCSSITICPVITCGSSDCSTSSVVPDPGCPPFELSDSSYYTSLCNPNSGTAVVTPDCGSHFTYLWDDPAATTDSIITGLSAGAYSVTVTNTEFAGCDTTLNFNLPILEALPNPIITGDNQYCAGQTANLNAGGPYSSYLWSNGATSQAVNVTAGNYTVTVTNGNGCAVTSPSFAVTESPLPNITATNDGPACTGDDVSFSTSGGVSYTWSGPNGFSSTSANPIINNISGNEFGVYTVSGTDANGCVNTSQTTVIENCGLNASFNLSSNTICVGSTITFTDNSTGGTIISWLWTFNGGAPASANTQGPHTITFASPGTYNITLDVDDNLGFSDDTTIVVTVNGLPIVAASNDGPVCFGDDIVLSSNGGVSYSWSGPSGFNSILQNPTINNISSSEFGIYTVTVTDINGCVNTAQTEILESCPPVASFNPSEIIICAGISILFQDNSTGTNIDTWNWDFQGGSPAIANSQGPHLVYFNSPGVFSINLEVVNNTGLIDDTTIIVTVKPSPIAVIDANPTIGVAPLVVNYDNLSVGGANYYWDFGNDSTIFINDLTNQNQSYDSIGNYLVILVAELDGCFDTTSVTISVIDPIVPPIIISFPNIFTPNGDGTNEFFLFNGENIKSLELVILNRWGNIVYESNEIDFTWDGKTSDGLKVSNGVYFYTYKVTGLADDVLEGHDFVNVQY